MSDATEDGGPAFPSACFEGYEPEFGMTLRDYFAGQALAGLKANPAVDVAPNDAAKHAYRYADAMLAARKAPAR